MIITFKRDHEALTNIISNAIARSGSKIINVDLRGTRTETGLLLGASVEIRTKQGDLAKTAAEHSAICAWVNASLEADGYDLSRFQDAIIEGNRALTEAGSDVQTDITWTCTYDIGPDFSTGA